MMSKIFTMLTLMTLLASCGNNKTETLAPAETTESLPFLGIPTYEYTEKDGVTYVDTIQHTIPPFSFTDQDGNTVTEKTVEGRIYVADFIFTSCPSICPIMTGNLKKVQDEFKDNPNLLILSHSIDPSFDSPEVLKKYAAEKGADTKMWKFLTGNQDSIYDICEKSYMAFAQINEGAPGGYLHSGFLVLIDKNRHIRGAYDGTIENKTEDLIRDIKLLLQEK